MKNVIFISKSRLAQNLFGLLMPQVPGKISFAAFDSIDAAAKMHFAKPIHLLALDRNALPESLGETDLSFAQKNNLKKANRILIHSRHDALDSNALNHLEIKQSYAKPFLAEELVTIVKNNLA